MPFSFDRLRAALFSACFFLVPTLAHAAGNLAVAVGSPASDEAYTVAFGAPSQVTRVAYCKGMAVAACQASSSAQKATGFARNAGDRKIFLSSAKETLANATSLAILGFDAQGRVVESAGVRFDRVGGTTTP